MKKTNIFLFAIRPLAITITLTASMFSSNAQSGNLGVGTNAPASKLSVNGNASIGSGYQTIAAPADGAIIKGRVGIGNSAPGEMLEVGGPSGMPNPGILMHSSSNTLDSGGVIKFRENSTSYGSNIRHSTGADATRTEGLYFESVNNGSPTPIMVVDQLNNRIGIGNTLPATKLDVNGAFRTRSLSPSTNGGSGNIPLGTSSFTVFNGDFVASITLPAGAPEGQRMVVYSSATSDATINTTNTSLTSAITMKTGEYYEFYSNGSVWYINPAVALGTNASPDYDWMKATNQLPNAPADTVNDIYHIGGSVTVGTINTPPNNFIRFRVFNNDGSQRDDIENVSFVNDASAPVFAQGKARRDGSGNPLSIQNGDVLGSYRYIGWVGSTPTRTFMCGVEAGYTGDGINTNSELRFQTSTLQRMVIDGFGRVGINTATPRAPLDVAYITAINTTGTGTYFSDGATGFSTSGAGANFASIIANGNIWTQGAMVAGGGAITASDARIKNIKGISDSKADLGVLNKIQITNYTMKDNAFFGNQEYKKVIAQQVEKVYPLAVRKMSNFIPDIFTKASKVAIDGEKVNITMAKAHNLKAGDKVRLIDEKDVASEVTVDAIDGNSFTVTIQKPENQYFVFGKQVDDFRSVDYEAISMLNVSATQELTKRIEKLEAENATLKSTVANISDMKKELDALKASVEKIVPQEATASLK